MSEVMKGNPAPKAKVKVKAPAAAPRPPAEESTVATLDLPDVADFDMEAFFKERSADAAGLTAKNAKLRSELALVSKGIEGLVSMEASDPIIYSPTRSPSLNRAMQIGGAPSRCTWVITGPYGTGKTALTLLVGSSAQEDGDLFVFIDAEHAADTHQWFDACGVYLPGAGYYRPDTYEQTVLHVAKLIQNFAKAKETGAIPKHRKLILVVDSINKLVPKAEMEQLFKTELGRQFPLRAMLNSAWLDRMTPVVGKNDISFILLAQESQNVDAGMFGKKTKMKGGDRLGYESAVLLRVDWAENMNEKVKKASADDEDDGDDKDDGKVFTGRVLHYTVVKNKVGVCNEKGYLCISTGKGEWPKGFDFPREVDLELEHRGAWKQKGKAYYHPVLAGFPVTELPKGKAGRLRFLRTRKINGVPVWEVLRGWLDDQLAAERGRAAAGE